MILLDTLQPLAIEARYPTYKEQLMATLDKSKCKKLINETGEFMKWIKNQL